MPALLNTSFNLKGESIVETPADAVSTFLAGGMDALLISPEHLSHLTGSTSKIFLRHAAHARPAALAARRTSRETFAVALTGSPAAR